MSLTISETSLALPSIQAPAENHNQEWWLLGENPFLVQIHLLLSQFMQSQNCDCPQLPVRAWVRQKRTGKDRWSTSRKEWKDSHTCQSLNMASHSVSARATKKAIATA